MTVKQYPELLEVEYSFRQGGHNSLKLVDGRLFFFSEADSHLSEKNQYLTLVSIPSSEKWTVFWEDLDHCGIRKWEECLISVDAEEVSEDDHHHDASGNCQDANCHCDSDENNILNREKIPPADDISLEGDIWQVKIIHGSLRVFCKNWCLGEVDEESIHFFFKAVKKLSGVGVTIHFDDLLKKLVSQ